MRIERVQELQPLETDLGWSITVDGRGHQRGPFGFLEAVYGAAEWARGGYTATVNRIDPPRPKDGGENRTIPAFRFRP